VSTYVLGHFVITFSELINFDDGTGAITVRGDFRIIFLQTPYDSESKFRPTKVFGETLGTRVNNGVFEENSQRSFHPTQELSRNLRKREGRKIYIIRLRQKVMTQIAAQEHAPLWSKY